MDKRIISILLLLSVSAYFFYNFYTFHYTRYKSRVLASFNPNKKYSIFLYFFSSITYGLMALLFAIGIIVLISDNVKTSIFDLLILFGFILFFGIVSIYYFPFNRLRLQFTDKGFIYDSLFFSWDDIKEIEWRPIKNGAMFKLRISMSWKARLRRTWVNLVPGHIFDINNKQTIDKILEGKVKIRS